MYLALFVAVPSMGTVGLRPVEGGWRDVLRDGALLRFAVAGLMMLTFGYGNIDAGLSLCITSSVGLDEHFIGVIVAAHTMVIVAMQPVVIGLIRGRSRTRMLGGVGVLWASSWLLFGAAAAAPATWAAVGVLIVAISVFAIGETLWSPVAPALLNDLAPEHLRGRFNAFQSILWGVSGALGPLITGAFLAAGGFGPWPVRSARGGPARPAAACGACA